MAIEGISNSLPQVTLPESRKPSGGTEFGEALVDAAKQVSGLEGKANEMAQKIASGDIAELHSAMIAMQKASMAMELTVQVRNKVLEAYQEIMRMQI